MRPVLISKETIGDGPDGPKGSATDGETVDFKAVRSELWLCIHAGLADEEPNDLMAPVDEVMLSAKSSR